MKKVILPIVLIFGFSTGNALAEAGAWSAYKDTGQGASGRTGSAPSADTRTWNEEKLNLETRTVAELLIQDYSVISVQLNYLSGSTEVYLYKRSGHPKLIQCQLRSLRENRNSVDIGSRCMGF